MVSEIWGGALNTNSKIVLYDQDFCKGLHNLRSAEGPGAEGGPEGARGRLKWARCAWEKKEKKKKKKKRKGKRKKEKEKKGKKEILIIEALLSIKKNVLYVTLR